MEIDFEELKFGKAFLKPSFTLNTHSSQTGIIVVGCGGTGGRLIPLLAQHIANHNKEVRTNPRNTLYIKSELTLVLFDSKIVLPKNLDRQNFYQFDLGKNKAQVLAERYSALSGIDIVYKSCKWDGECDTVENHDFRNAIIFDCTDNKEARKSIESMLPASNTVIISCGNEEDFGQVLYSFKHQERWGDSRATQLFNSINSIEVRLKSTEPKKNEFNITAFPTILELFRDFKDTPTASCTDMVLVNEQSMPINSLVAQLAYNMFYEIVSGKSLNYNMVKCNVNNVFSTQFISKPSSCLKVLYKGFFGVDTFELSRKIYNEYLVLVSDRSVCTNNFQRIRDFAKEYPIHSGPLLQKFVNEYGYSLGTDKCDEIKNFINSSKDALEAYFKGDEEDANI